MAYPYTVNLTIGSYNWTRTLGDAPALPEILDGLTVGWQFPDSELWPVQPEPVTASFSLLAAAASDLSGIDIGTPVHLRVFAGAKNGAGVDSPTVRLAGRVTQLDGNARKFVHPATGLDVEGWQLDVQCADYTADAAEITVFAPTADLHADLAGQHDTAERIMVLVSGLPNPWNTTESPTDPPQGAGIGNAVDLGDYLAVGTGGGGVFEGAAPFLIEAADSTAANMVYGPTSLAETFDRYLSIWANAGSSVAGHASDDPLIASLWPSQGWRRAIYRAKLDAAGVPLTAQPWRLEWVSRRNLSTTTRSTLPLKFGLHSGVYGPIKAAPDPTKAADGSLLLDADTIDYDATWTRTKQTEPNRVVVSNSIPDPTQIRWRKVVRSDAESGDAVITTMMEAPHLNSNTVGFLADMYNGDDEQLAANQWGIGAVTWYASRDASWPRNTALFPDAELWPGHSTPIVIEAIPAAQKPLPNLYVGGHPRGVSFNIAAGEFRFDFELYPRIPRPAGNGGALDWAHLSTSFPAVTWQQLDASATWIDYRLIHTTAID